MEVKVHLERVGKAIVPKYFRRRFKDYLSKAGYQFVPYTLLGSFFYIILVLAFLVYFPLIYFPFLVDKNPIFVGVLTFILWIVLLVLFAFIFVIFIYAYLNVRIYKRTKNLELVFADYLILVVTNLKGGMSFESALWKAVRPEFNVLADEIQLVSKQVLTGNDVVDALYEFSSKYNSMTIKRSMNLIISEIKSGGKIVNVIEKIISNLNKARLLKEQMKASTLTFMIFISVIVVLISPLLFALSYQLLNIMINFLGKLDNISTSSTMAMSFQMSSDFDTLIYRRFSMGVLGIISICASLIVSIIERGDIRDGMKYMPSFFLSTEFLYIVFFNILQGVFGGLANI